MLTTIDVLAYAGFAILLFALALMFIHDIEKKREQEKAEMLAWDRAYYGEHNYGVDK